MHREVVGLKRARVLKCAIAIKSETSVKNIFVKLYRVCQKYSKIRSIYAKMYRGSDATNTSVFQMLKDIGMSKCQKSVETRKHPCSKTGDDGYVNVITCVTP